jgi:hypothetical protein
VPGEPIHHFVLTNHALEELARRDLSITLVERVMASPEQRFGVRPGREVLQSRVQFGTRLYLVRVFVDLREWPPQVVTAYRTSRFAKYWRAT